METKTRTPPAAADESLTDLLKRLADDFTAVLRAELELLQRKAKDVMQSVVGGAILAMTGGMLLLAAVLSLTGALFLWLLYYLDPLPAAFATAASAAIIGGIMVMLGYALVKKAVRKKLL